MTDDTERRNAILSDIDPHEALRMVLQREAETAERRDARENTLRAHAEAAERLLVSGGIADIMLHNADVRTYITRLEARAEAAEAERDRLREALEQLHKTVDHVTGKRWINVASVEDCERLDRALAITRAALTDGGRDDG